MRELLTESVGGLNPSDIYNFYFLWWLYVDRPNLFQSDYGKFILDEFSEKLRNKYVRLFKQLISEQLQKYAARKRIDPDFDASKISPSAPAKTLYDLMQKTFRSDMQRRNDVWNIIAEHTAILETAKTPKDIFVSIDRLNAAIHNTNTSVLGKFIGGQNLIAAYDTTDKHNPQYWKQHVDKDLRQLASQDGVDEKVVQESNNNITVSKKDRENVMFMSGLKQGVLDKGNEVKRDLSGDHEDFQRGYKLIKRDSWWTKANDRLTNWAASLGNSYGKHH